MDFERGGRDRVLMRREGGGELWPIFRPRTVYGFFCSPELDNTREMRILVYEKGRGFTGGVRDRPENWKEMQKKKKISADSIWEKFVFFFSLLCRVVRGFVKIYVHLNTKF